MNDIIQYIINHKEYALTTIFTIGTLIIAYYTLMQANARLEIIPEYSNVDINNKTVTIIKFKVINTGQKTASNISFTLINKKQKFFKDHYLITKYPEIKGIMGSFEKIESNYEKDKVSREIVLNDEDKILYDELNKKIKDIFNNKESEYYNSDEVIQKKLGFFTKLDVIENNLKKVYLKNKDKEFYINKFFNSNVSIVANSSHALIHFTDIESYYEYQSFFLYEDIDMEIKYQEIKKLDVIALLISIIPITFLLILYPLLCIPIFLIVLILSLTTKVKYKIKKNIKSLKDKKSKKTLYLIEKFNIIKKFFSIDKPYVSGLLNLLNTKFEINKMRVVTYKSEFKTVVLHSNHLIENYKIRNQISYKLNKEINEKNGREFFNSFYVKLWISNLHKNELKEFNKIAGKNKHNVRLYIEDFDTIKNKMLKQKYYDLLDLIKELDFISSDDQWECRKRLYMRDK